MPVQLVGTNLDGKYAKPKHHPTTCANPVPWLILWVKIECHSWDRDRDGYIDKVWIRGKSDEGDESIWFRADQCYIGSKEELTD